MLPFLKINRLMESISKFDICGIKLSFKHLLFANTTLQEFFNTEKVCRGFSQAAAEHKAIPGCTQLLG